jgi:aminoglycoside 6-adenylyltransferase
MQLFREVSKEVAESLGYAYPEHYDRNVTRYVEDMYREYFGDGFPE